MSGKVLLSVYSIQVKKDLLSMLWHHGVEVIEVHNEYDFLFKYKLAKEHLTLQVIEFDEKAYEASLAVLEKVTPDQIPTILMIHEYTSRIIDQALKLKVKDIVVLPADKTQLEKKILGPLMLQVKKPEPTRMPTSQMEEQREDVVPETKGKAFVFDDGPVKEEIIRADRGRYPLGLVLVHYTDFDTAAEKSLDLELRHQLRTTDRILRYDENHWLVLCPFTDKEHLVSVENKIREAYRTVGFKGELVGSLLLYGVAYPIDGKEVNVLFERLKDGLHDSRFFSNLEGTLNRLNDQEIRDRLRRRM